MPRLCIIPFEQRERDAHRQARPKRFQEHRTTKEGRFTILIVVHSAPPVTLHKHIWKHSSTCSCSALGSTSKIGYLWGSISNTGKPCGGSLYSHSHLANTSIALKVVLTVYLGYFWALSHIPAPPRFHPSCDYFSYAFTKESQL